METLRFAPLIRVSTEKQEPKESLRTQTTQIKEYVELLHGIIPDHCWQYAGQEHATPGQERKRLEQLLTDSSKGLFDAVIVCDASRWSRDNLRSKEGLEIFRNNGIKFFVGTTEQDLYDNTQMFMLGTITEVNEWIAKEQAKKSIINRIHRAKRGVPASGLLPYGRTFDKKTEKWDIDPVKKQIIEECAKRYIAGDSLKDIGATYGMDYTNLWNILNTKSGTEMTCRFRYKNIDETVIMTIPRLLEDDVIAEIHKKAQAKKTYSHGSVNVSYLLSRMIFCKKCGYPYFGVSSASGRRYYRHARYIKDCKEGKTLDANQIELAILIHLVKTLGDVERMKMAVKQATPNMIDLDKLNEEKDNLKNELINVVTRKLNLLISKIADEKITDEEAEPELNKLRKRKGEINKRILVIDAEIKSTPKIEDVKKLSHFAGKVLHNALKTGDPTSYILKKDYKWKRNLIEHTFGGTDSEGNRLGVYLERVDKTWNFEIRGLIENIELTLPLSDKYLIELYNLDPEYCDVDERLREIKKDITNLAKS